MRYSTIYFVGIKGVGMTSLAVIAKEAGCTVTGSDVKNIFITDSVLKENEIQVFEGFVPENLDHITDKNENVLVITTGAHNGLANPECVEALRRGIEVVTQGKAVGLYMDGQLFGDRKKGISIAGTHGKTTITALLATSLFFLKEDPSYTIGTSEIFPLGAGGHFGKGTYLVAEADEYASDIHLDPVPRFFYQKPYAAIINNIDFDHPDFYQNIGMVKEAFSNFIDQVAENGIIIANGDDENVRDIMRNKGRDWTSFGENAKNDYTFANVTQDERKTTFELIAHGKNEGRFSLSVIGVHNVQNALPVIVVLKKLGFEFEKIKKALPLFTGTKRRSEYLGATSGGAVILDDYAHHPREIKTTLQSISEAYKGKEMICIFQPHTYSRTRALLSEFAKSFDNVSTLFFMKVFASARESVTDKKIYKEIEQGMDTKKMNVFFPENNEFVLEYIKNNLNSDKYVLITMGAGDVYKIADSLKKI